MSGEVGGKQIGCPQCKHPNMVYPPLEKYKEVVYEPCETDGVEGDHNFKTDIECSNCYEKFKYYWCTGHTYVEGANKSRNFDENVKWPQS
jgi:hypothetical protein